MRKSLTNNFGLSKSSPQRCHPRESTLLLFIELTSDNDLRTNSTRKLNFCTTPNRKERKKSKMSKRKRKKEDGSKKEVKYISRSNKEKEEVSSTDQH